jgi:hypothetical protein
MGKRGNLLSLDGRGLSPVFNESIIFLLSQCIGEHFDMRILGPYNLFAEEKFIYYSSD